MASLTASTPMTVRLMRSGNFLVHWNGSNATQCGAVGTQRLKYAVKITGSSLFLTPQGFIIDNREVDRYFQEKYSKVKDFESCEVIAMTACEDLAKMFGQGELEGVKVKEIEVMISGSFNSGLIAIWRGEVE